MLKILVRALTTKYFQFSARAGRKEYWIVYLFGLALGNLAFFIAQEHTIFGLKTFWLLVFVLTITLLPFITVYVRRFHDFNFNGWWVVPITLSPILIQSFMGDTAVFIIELLINGTVGLIPGTHGPNKYGEPSIN
jgi:uncharacterized membrane protein YhaH (DUF805 family)